MPGTKLEKISRFRTICDEPYEGPRQQGIFSRLGLAAKAGGHERNGVGASRTRTAVGDDMSRLTRHQRMALRSVIARATEKRGVGGVSKVRSSPKPVTLPALPFLQGADPDRSPDYARPPRPQDRE
jgi:hypothetical protein